MTKFENFLKSVENKTIDVIGLGISNLPLIKLLCENGAKVTVLDKNTQIDKSLLENYSVEYKLGENYLENLKSDIIFRTPGLNYFNEYLQKAKANGSVITSEMEVFFEVCPCEIIAITGSDGKTTTTTLISEILKNDGKTVHVGGNIGKPLLSRVDKMQADDICVVELSSFQLMAMPINPSVSVITNITPNHLDMHKDMTEYIEAKLNICNTQTEKSKLVVNFDDKITKSIKTDACKYYFSMKSKVENGVYLNSDDIVISENQTETVVMKKQDIVLPGEHNVANYLTAICATKHLVDVKKIVEVARNFCGVEHRIEFVREFKGVKYYNDSIASSPTRAIAGIKSFDKKIILLAGGYDKNLDYQPLAPIICNQVKKLVLIGATAKKIKKAVREIDKELEIVICEDFIQSVEKTKELAESGDIVMMSPASASFDLFKNFMERGNLFKKIVNDFK